MNGDNHFGHAQQHMLPTVSAAVTECNDCVKTDAKIMCWSSCGFICGLAIIRLEHNSLQHIVFHIV